MANVETIIQMLTEERNRYDRAIQILAGVRSGTISNRAATKALAPSTRLRLDKVTKRRTMSAAARRRISAAQRARWAKFRGQKVVPIKTGKRRISAAGRARISAAAKARWARVKAGKK